MAAEEKEEGLEGEAKKEEGEEGEAKEGAAPQDADEDKKEEGDDKADGDKAEEKSEEKAGGLAELTPEQLSKYKASTIKTEITTIEEVCPGHPTHSSLNHTL